MFNNGVPVLMYHFFYNTESELSSIKPEERSYALSVAKFRAQLKTLHELYGSRAIVTFDDGHRSVADFAAAELEPYQFRKIFFVSTDLIDRRQDFCDWETLRTLSSNGFSIQSHGCTHRYLSELAPTELRKELKQSKQNLEDKIGIKVEALSFPGGRFNSSVLQESQELYQHLYTSRFGFYNESSHDAQLIPRIAIRRTVDEPRFSSLIMPTPLQYGYRYAKQRSKEQLQKIIGAAMYDRIYQALAR